jgi:hypothetical protein
LICLNAASVAIVMDKAGIDLLGAFRVNFNGTLVSKRVEKCLTTCAISHAITSPRFLKCCSFVRSEKNSYVRKFLTRWPGGLRLGCLRQIHIFPESCLAHMVERTMSFALQAGGAKVLPGAASHLFSFHHT